MLFSLHRVLKSSFSVFGHQQMAITCSRFAKFPFRPCGLSGSKALAWSHGFPVPSFQSFSELFSMPSLQSLQLHVQRSLLGASSDLCVRISHVEWIKDVDDLIVINELSCLLRMPWSSSDRPQLARYEKEVLLAIQAYHDSMP